MKMFIGCFDIDTPEDLRRTEEPNCQDNCSAAPSVLKQKLDEAGTFSEAEGVVSNALYQAGRAEILYLLKELYNEFRSPGSFGGEAGTLAHIRRIFEFIQPTQAELAEVQIDSEALCSYLNHGTRVRYSCSR